MATATRVKKIIAKEWLLLLLMPAVFLMLAGLAYVSKTVRHMDNFWVSSLVFGPYVLVQLARITIWAVKTVKGGE